MYILYNKRKYFQKPLPPARKADGRRKLDTCGLITSALSSQNCEIRETASGIFSSGIVITTRKKSCTPKHFPGRQKTDFCEMRASTNSMSLPNVGNMSKSIPTIIYIAPEGIIGFSPG